MLASKFEVGSRFEVEEGGVWYPVRVLQEEESRVWIHFEGWSQRHDRWIDKDSTNVRGRRHTMKRRSRNEDERPSKRPSTTLKVGGVFQASARRNRKSVDQPTKDNKSQPEKLKSVKETKNSAASEKAPTTPPIVTTPPVTKGTSLPVSKVAQSPLTKGVALPTTKGPPPVGWAYEVIKDPLDLVPKKAFTISEDHNKFKCTESSCNKSFRKEKLLQSHLKHYHGISLPEDAAIAVENPAQAATPSQEAKRRRIRKSKSDVEEPNAIERDKELAIETVTETSVSTDNSDVTVIDNAETLELIKEVKPSLKTADPQPTNSSPVGLTQNTTAVEKSLQSTPQPSAGSSSGGTPVSRAPVYGRVGQNRFVPIPEPLVLGREKRRVVKTERMQEAEGVFMKRQKGETPTEKAVTPKIATDKEKRRKSYGGEKDKGKESTTPDEVAQPEFKISEVQPSDEDTICSPTVLSPSSSQKNAQDNVERDMVHCYCGVVEESGLMMQCDLCLCWQHGSCFGIENEQLVPDKYVCIACQNARRVLQKQSHKIASFRAMAEGRLPGLSPGSTASSQRFVNLTQVATVMTNLRKALRGLEIRITKIMNDREKPLEERRMLLDKAVNDIEIVQRQMDTCERIMSAIDRPNADQGNEALILKSTVKSVLKDLWTVQRLALFK